jgi:Fe-S oxidoreductase
MIQSSLIVSEHDSGDVLIETDCNSGELGVELPAGTYDYEFRVESTDGLLTNDSVVVETTFTIKAYQPLLLYGEDAGNGLAGRTVDLSNDTALALEGDYAGVVVNPTYHVNPKSLDAKLTYAMFIPCLAAGAGVFVVLRNMARGYEFEMNKCYGCDLCDDACPVRLFNAGDKLNIIYNSWNNEDDGVPMYSCLTCTACTNACPQLVDYDSYVDIRRTLIVGGPAAEIPHTVLQAVLAAEAEEDSDADFVAVEDYPIDSNVGYYPGCVDYLDQEMVFSHLNEGDMNLGDTTTAAFTLFEEMGTEVSYLGRDFLKCCGHDQKWQGLDEVFDKLKSYNQKKIEASGIDTLVSSCAECFRTFARDYELEGIKVMHTTEYLIENGFDMEMKVEDELTVTYHDPCRLGRQMGIYEEPRELVAGVEGVQLVEMEHHGEDAMCCGVSSMMSCNENARALRVSRMEEIRNTGADMMITSCPKCVSHFECLKFEGDERHDIEILDVVSFLARQVDAKKSLAEESAVTPVTAEA